MIEEFCKYLFGDDVWGLGMFLIVAWSFSVPYVAIPLLAELPKFCKRLNALEEKVK